MPLFGCDFHTHITLAGQALVCLQPRTVPSRIFALWDCLQHRLKGPSWTFSLSSILFVFLPRLLKRCVSALIPHLFLGVTRHSRFVFEYLYHHTGRHLHHRQDEVLGRSGVSGRPLLGSVCYG